MRHRAKVTELIRRNAAASTTVRNCSRVSLKSGGLDPRKRGGRALGVGSSISPFCVLRVTGLSIGAACASEKRRGGGQKTMAIICALLAMKEGSSNQAGTLTWGVFAVSAPVAASHVAPCSRFFFSVFLNFLEASRRASSPL